MSDPTLQELLESIEALTTYRDRLVADVRAMGQRLKLPQKKVDDTLASHAELQRIEAQWGLGKKKEAVQLFSLTLGFMVLLLIIVLAINLIGVFPGGGP